MQQCTWSASGDTWYTVINKDWVSFKLTVKYFILKTSLRDVPGHACPVVKTAFQCKGCWGFPGDSGCKESSYKAEDIDVGSIPGSGRSLGEGNATHSSILAWRIPWTEEPSGLRPQCLKEYDRTEDLCSQGMRIGFLVGEPRSHMPHGRKIRT